MKSILAFCVIFYFALYNMGTVQAEAKFDCLKRVVRETVGDDAKYSAWIVEVDKSNANAFKMINSCASLPLEIQPMCYKNVVEFINGATVTLANKLTQIDSNKDWPNITKACVESKN